MAPTSPARRLKRWAIAALVVLAVVLIALSPSFGRAEPSGEYRPPLPPDALKNGCYPLPDGLQLGFSYQVRTDGDVEGRRQLVVQYNLIDREEAFEALLSDFEDAGYERTESSNRGPGLGASLRKGDVEVNAVVSALDPLTDDQLVRGTIELDLPVVARQSDAPICSDVESTKRFAEADQ